MLALLADENFDNRIVRGIQHVAPEMDVIRVQDVGMSGSDDPTVLEWAAEHGRITLTLDVRTMPTHAYQRVASGLPMPGVVAIRRQTPIAEAIEALVIFASCSLDNEWENQVIFLP